MNVGILTTFFSKNYGAALQAYATARVVETLGCHAEMIDYRRSAPEYYVPAAVLKAQSERSLPRKIGQKAKNFMAKIRKPDQSIIDGSVIRNRAFDQFVEDHLALSRASYRSTEAFIAAVPDMPYDVFLCGSDQIWNPIVHNFDDVYYLNFKTAARKVAYASSVAYDNFTEEEIRRICRTVESIDCISVREKSTAARMQPHMDKPVEQVIDPTFLLDREDWLRLPSNQHFDGPYILVYILNYNEQNKNITRLVSDLARRSGCRIICLPYTPLRFSDDVETEYRYDIAPNDFIRLLSGASCVITNSFHATALSVNLNIPFYVVSSHQRNKDLQARISDLLEEIGLNDRRIYPDTPSIDLDAQIDFEPVNRIVSRRRQEGLAYLTRALDGGDKK